MPVRVESVDTLRRYFKRVVERAEHHGKNVNEVVFALVGMVLVYMDEDSEITVHGTEGSEGNILWFYIHGERYAFRYAHEQQAIELRIGKHTGEILRQYTNRTPISSIKLDFGLLR